MTMSTPRPRRHHAAALLLAVALGAQPAAALPRCGGEADQTVFELEALKTELMVIATTCKQEDLYNAFIQKYQSQLAQNGKAFGQYFARVHGAGRAGNRANDVFITNLANARSTAAYRLGSDYCPRNSGLFEEVMALRGPGDLAPYAAGKDLLSHGVTACEGAPEQHGPRARTAAR